MGVANLYKAINQKLDDWKDNYPSDCGFMIKANEYIIELLDKGILDSVKDGTFKGWGV